LVVPLIKFDLASLLINPQINPGPAGFLEQHPRTPAPTGLEGIWDGKPANGFEPMAFALQLPLQLPTRWRHLHPLPHLPE
jgi:hypothetical protein